MTQKAIGFVIALVVVSGSAWAQSDTSVLEGVWAVQDMSYEPAGPAVSNPTGSIIFSGQHYSIMFLSATDRPDMAPLEWNDASAERLLAVWGPLTANAGTFELSEDTVTFHPTVAKNTFPIGAAQEWSCTLDGDRLVLTRDLNAPNQPTTRWTVTLTRVE